MLFLLLQLGEQRYAIAATEVREVLPVVTIRPIAHAPDGVAGVADYRGVTLPVVDLSQVVLSRAAEPRRSTRLVVVTVADRQRTPQLLGLIAERVTEVAHFTEAQFRRSGVTSANATYLGDMARINGVLVQRLDLDRLLPAAVRDALFQQAAEPDAA